MNFSKISSISHSAEALFEAHTGSKSGQEKQQQMKGKDAEHSKICGIAKWISIRLILLNGSFEIGSKMRCPKSV